MKQDIVDKLKTWNMSEYEAIIYVTLVNLRKGSARDIHELTGIPRGRVYETLRELVSKGFIDVIDTNPSQYRALDIRPTFEKLKKNFVLSLDEIIEGLEDIEKDTSSSDLPCFKLTNEWAIENQITGLVRRLKKQIVILCNDPGWYSKFRDLFKEANKKADLYLIVNNPADYCNAGVKIYSGDTLVKSAILGVTKEGDNKGELLCVIFADKYEKIMVFLEEGKETGLCSSSFVMTEFIIRSILDRITLVNMKTIC